MPTQAEPKAPDHSIDEFRRACVAINDLFWRLAEEGIMEYRDHWPKRTTPENILWVGRDKTMRRKFRRIVEGIDTFAHMHEKAAYLLRAFSGLQLFPDANHRTGVLIVAIVCDQNGYIFDASPAEMKRLVEEIRPLHGAVAARRTVDRILDRDASFDYICEFMARHVRPHTWRERLRRRFRRSRHFYDVGAKIPLYDVQAHEGAEAEHRRKAGLR